MKQWLGLAGLAGLVWLVGCAAGDDLQRALTGREAPTDPHVIDAQAGDAGRRPDARVPRDAEPPRDARPPQDAAPPADAALPPPDASPPPPDAALEPDAGGPCDDRVGRACRVGVGACLRRGQLACGPDGLMCNVAPGQPEAEACDGQDNDCDGQADEGVANACGQCGVPPPEVCNGVDDDCNGAVDEGLLNACGECGPVPAETCDGLDEDCDGQVDEGVRCRGWILRPGANRWTAPPGLNSRLAQGAVVDAAAAIAHDSMDIWAFIGDRIHIYRVEEDRWIADVPLAILPAVEAPVEMAEAVPLWWRLRNDPKATRASLMVTRGETIRTLDVDPVALVADGVSEGPIDADWMGDDLAPRRPYDFRALVLDLRNERGFWRGRPREFCEGGAPALGPTAGVLNRDRLHLLDAGICFVYVESGPAGAWPGFDLADAPAEAAVTAWTHGDPAAPGGGVEVMFLR